MSIIDVIVILLILMGAIVGFKHGAIKEGTKFIGIFVIIIISFLLKDKLMVMLYENLPFFDFFGAIKGLDAINILFYQLISFIFIFTVLFFALKVLMVVTGLVEWLLKMTVFLSLPSKLLGIVVGVLEYYVYVFVGLYVLNMPIFNLGLINDSKVGEFILNRTPVLSSCVDGTVKVYTDVWEIVKNKDEYSDKKVNTLVLATLLDHDLIELDSAKRLVEANRIRVDDENILDSYDDKENFYRYLDKIYKAEKEEEENEEDDS